MEKILIVARKNDTGGFSGYDTLVIKVREDFEISENKILVLQLNKSQSFNLEFVKVIEEIKPISDSITGTAYDNYNCKAKRPFFVSNINLDNYILTLKNIARKEELEKKIKSMAKKIEMVNIFKQLADLNPELKDEYEEYMELIKFETGSNQNLLPGDSKSES